MIRIAIIDDHQLFLDGLKSLVQNFDGVQVITEASNGREFLKDPFLDKIHIALLDLEMPELNGIETMQELQKNNHGIKVIILSRSKEPHLITSLMKLGASGYLPKDVSANALNTALHSVYETGYFFNELVTPSLLIKMAQGNHFEPDFLLEELSPREKEVLKLICKEHTTSEIAEKLILSPRTIDGYREKIMVKTGARNSAGMVVYAVKNNLIDVN